jgi:hypothetical protein
MRGPGPRWREKHCAVSARDGSIQVSAREPQLGAQVRRAAVRNNNEGRLS